MAYDPLMYGQAVKAKTINLNSANTDAASWTGLPSRLKVVRFSVHNASTSLAASAATLGLRDASGGGGNVIVTAAVMTTLSAGTKTVDMTIALGDVIVAGALYARLVLAHGSAATADVYLEYIDLT